MSARDKLAAQVAEHGPFPMPTGESMHADSKACGTCKSLTQDGKPVEHEQCAARAVLLLPPDQPMYENLVDLTDEQRKALPARFHTPVFDGLGKPNAWLCQVCWGDGWVSPWPCGPAQQKGAMVFVSEGTAEDIAAELVRLRAQAPRVRRFTPLEEAVQGVETAIAPLTGDAREGADLVLAYLRTLATPDTTVPRDPRPGADAARRMIADRQTAEDPHDSPLHRTYETSYDLPETAPDPLAYGPTGYRCGCGKDAHSNLTPCQPMTADEWNARYPVGTPVTAFPVTRDDEGLTTVTRTPAWTLGHGAAVVSVDGYAGGICLTHVDPMPGGAS